MAIRFPNSKKNQQPISTTNNALNDLIDSMDQPASVQKTEIVHEEVSLKPVRKAVDKKQLGLLALLLLVGLGALAYFFLPGLLKEDEPAPVTVTTPKSKVVASAAKPASTATANASATASTAGLNNQTIVITGDKLKNGIPASTAQANPEAPANVAAPAPNNISNNNAPTNNEVAFAGEDMSGGKDQIDKSSKSSMSYADFVQMSESTVYADDSAPAAAKK